MSNSYIVLDPCLSDGQTARLLALVEGFEGYPLYVEDPIAEGIGKGLVRRHDAVMNYVTQKMARGERESMKDTAARTNLFRAVFAEGSAIELAGVEDLLYRHAPFLEAARALTGLDVVVPDMLYANFLLPGQELAVHTDTPEYRGLSKRSVPEWLLVAMYHSGLFEAWRVRIAGGVTFFRPPREGGAFVLYPHGPERPPERVGLRHNTSVLLDADAIFHGVDRVGGAGAPAPDILPGDRLVYAGDGTWDVRDGDAVKERVRWGELRLSIQWKALCFADEEARRVYASHEDDLTADRAIEMLVADMVDRGVLGAERPNDTQLAIRMIQTYIPFPSA